MVHQRNPRSTSRARSLLALALVASTACVSHGLRLANQAFEAGDYERAAAYYALEADRSPDDEELAARLWQARERALRDSLDAFEHAQQSGLGERAMAQLAHTITLQRGWYAARGRALPLEQAQRITAALTWAGSTLAEAAERELAQGRPLAAEQVLEREARVLSAPELRAQAQAEHARVAEAGRARCAELAASPVVTASPYLSRWASAYCVHFSAAAWPDRAAPEQVSQLSVHVSWNGTSDRDALRSELAIRDALARTPWFHAQATGRAELALTGELHSTHSTSPAVREAPWFERVPYESQESYLVPVEEPYLDTEDYDEEVPYTDYERRTETCYGYEAHGDSPGLCTHEVPVTRYRTEHRQRLVQKTRTRYETRYRLVTLYRDEARVFRYDVVQHRAEHQAECHGTLQIGGPAQGVPVHWADSFTQEGDQHGVTFMPAGVTPSVFSALSEGEWLARASLALPAAVERAARDAWAREYCTPAPPPGAEPAHAAARCTHGARNNAPAWAHAALRELLRDDWSGLRASL